MRSSWHFPHGQLSLDRAQLLECSLVHKFTILVRTKQSELNVKSTNLINSLIEIASSVFFVVNLHPPFLRPKANVFKLGLCFRGNCTLNKLSWPLGPLRLWTCFLDQIVFFFTVVNYLIGFLFKRFPSVRSPLFFWKWGAFSDQVSNPACHPYGFWGFFYSFLSSKNDFIPSSKSTCSSSTILDVSVWWTTLCHPFLFWLLSHSPIFLSPQSFFNVNKHIMNVTGCHI